MYCQDVFLAPANCMVEELGTSRSYGDTVLDYWHDTYKFEGRGRLLAYGNDARGVYIVLDATIFYPQGGGQPADNGTIDGKVHHYIQEDGGQLDDSLLGRDFELKIDGARRLTNAKLHTAGHLLAGIVEHLAKELKPTKGYHFPDGPSVEFQGQLSSMANRDLISAVEAIGKEKIEDKALLVASEVDAGESLGSKRGKKTRLVQIQGYEAVPCGGTHIGHLGELKELKIRKIQSLKGNTRICYWAS